MKPRYVNGWDTNIYTGLATIVWQRPQDNKLIQIRSQYVSKQDLQHLNSGDKKWHYKTRRLN